MAESLVTVDVFAALTRIASVGIHQCGREADDGRISLTKACFLLYRKHHQRWQRVKHPGVDEALLLVAEKEMRHVWILLTFCFCFGLFYVRLCMRWGSCEMDWNRRTPIGPQSSLCPLSLLMPSRWLSFVCVSGLDVLLVFSIGWGFAWAEMIRKKIKGLIEIKEMEMERERVRVVSYIICYLGFRGEDRRRRRSRKDGSTSSWLRRSRRCPPRPTKHEALPWWCRRFFLKSNKVIFINEAEPISLSLSLSLSLLVKILHLSERWDLRNGMTGLFLFAFSSGMSRYGVLTISKAKEEVVFQMEGMCLRLLVVGVVDAKTRKLFLSSLLLLFCWLFPLLCLSPSVSFFFVVVYTCASLRLSFFSLSFLIK